MKRILTENSVYLYDEEAQTVVRAESSHDLRRDGEALKLYRKPTLNLGYPAVFWLEPLGDESDITFRHTSRILRVEEVNGD